MSATVAQQYRGHSVWSALERLETTLADIGESLDDEGIEALSFHTSLTLLSTHTRRVLTNANPELVPISLLAPVETELNRLRTSLEPPSGQPRNRRQSPSKRLSDTWTNVGSLLTVLSEIPVITSQDDVEGLTAAISAFHEGVSERFDHVEARSTEIHSGLNDLKKSHTELANEIETQKGVLAGAISEFNKQAKEDLKVRTDEYDQSLSQLKNSVAQSVSEATSQRNAFRTEFDKKVAEFRSDFDDKVGDWETELDEETTRRKNETDQIIEDIGSKLVKAKELVEMIGEVTMTGHYQRNANEQKHAADRWRIAAVVAGSTAVASAIAVALSEAYFAADTNWSSILTRSTITLALVALATFLGSQSLRHRSREEDYKTLELELANLDPFLNSLDDKERKEIKAKLALRYFKGVEREPIKTNEVLQNDDTNAP